jgi:hypothetical protein
MLRIDITADGSLRHLRLIGDLRTDDFEELERHLKGSGEEVTLDLDCPYYVREWMNREKERRKPG